MIAVFINNNYRSIRVLNISLIIKRFYLLFEFFFIIAIFINNSYKNKRILSISLYI